MSVLNLEVDLPTAISTCNQAGVLTGDCAGATAAVVADIGFGALDYRQGQLSFGNPLSNKIPEVKLVGPMPDVPDINGTRIATPEELRLIESAPVEPIVIANAPEITSAASALGGANLESATIPVVKPQAVANVPSVIQMVVKETSTLLSGDNSGVSADPLDRLNSYFDSNNAPRISVPRDAEQIAAEMGIVTDAQANANRVMAEQIAIRERQALLAAVQSPISASIPEPVNSVANITRVDLPNSTSQDRELIAQLFPNQRVEVTSSRPAAPGEPNNPITQIIDNITGSKTDSSEAKIDANLGYQDITQSPLFRDGHLNVKGEALPIEKVKTIVDDLCKDLPTACSENLLSPVYHGSSSPSLYGLMQGDSVALKSLADLTAAGEPVFSEAKIGGILDPGTSSDIGGTGILSVSAIEPKSALEYSRPVSFDPKAAEADLAQLRDEFNAYYNDTLNQINSLNIPANDRQAIVDYFKSTLTYDQPAIQKTADAVEALLKKLAGSPELPAIKEAVISSRQGLYQRNSTLRTIDLLERQISAYPTLEPWKKDLLDNSFPVVYGIKPEMGHSSVFMNASDIPLDMGFKDGISVQEIQTVFVPKSEIPRLEKLWASLHPDSPMPFKLADINVLKPGVIREPTPTLLDIFDTYIARPILNLLF